MPTAVGFDAGATSEESLIQRLVPAGNVVLELARGRRLTDGLLSAGCEVDVVDAATFEGPAAALEQFAPPRRYDTIVFSDVLGYAREPLQVLKKCAALLSPRGFILAAVPNFGYGALRLALLSGAYEEFAQAQERDLRLHFFTPELSKNLFERAGYHVEQTLRRNLPWDAALDDAGRGKVDEAVLSELRRDPDNATVTYVIKAVPAAAQIPEQRESTEALKRRLQTVESQLEATLAANGDLRDAGRVLRAQLVGLR